MGVITFGVKIKVLHSLRLLGKIHKIGGSLLIEIGVIFPKIAE